MPSSPEPAVPGAGPAASVGPPPGTGGTEEPAERAYAFAKWAILNAVYAAGETFTAAGLAHELGVAEEPVRTALLRLELEGLLCRGPGDRAEVCRFSLQEFTDILEARVLVENHTARRSFDNRAAVLPRAEAAHEELKRRSREQDTAGFTACDRRFHECIVDGAGNSVLSSVYRTLRERQTLATSVVMRGRADRMGAAVDEHERILAALRGDDPEAFCRAVNEHLQWATALARESHT